MRESRYFRFFLSLSLSLSLSYNLYPNGYWRGQSAIKMLSKEAKVIEKQAFEFLKKQAIVQIDIPAPKTITRPRFDVC